MRVVVVGATGNVGTSVVTALAADGDVTSVLGVARRLPEWRPAKTQWVELDVAHDDVTSSFAGADAVVHLGWRFQPTHDPAVTWESNVVGSGRVFEAVKEAHVPTLVYASSVGAYSPGPKDRAVDESWPTHGWPGASYTREKAYVERMLDVFERDHRDCRVVRLRPGFLFKRTSASEQWRIFAGRLLPSALLRPRLLPVVPDLAGLRFQAAHTDDVAQAYVSAVKNEVRGAFNIAADPVVDANVLAELLDARPVSLPISGIRGALAAAWHARAVPTDPGLLDAVLRLPVMDTTRARLELRWTPRFDAVAALREFFDGLREGDGMATAPMAPRSSSPA
jgi:nucleoside-diphosphate-sugar epimerase